MSFAAILLQAAALTPALPTASTVFDSPQVLAEITTRCRAFDPCVETARREVRRLSESYSSAGSTPDQRVKLLVMIDDARRDGSVDWPGIAASYFAWRQLVGGYLKAPSFVRAPSDSSTISTTCRTYGTGGNVTSSCTTSRY